MTYIDAFRRDWHDDAEMFAMCMSVMSSFDRAGKQDHYSFAQIREMGAFKDDAKLAAVLMYLSNPALKLVHPVFFVDVPDEEIEEIEPNDNGDLIHPHSGALLDKSEVLVGFELGPNFHHFKVVNE